MQTTLLLAQALCCGWLAAWLTLGVRNNILYAAANESLTAEVLAMTRMQAQYPDMFAPVAHRAITDRRLQLRAFRGVVIAEALATLILWAGAVALLLAAVGLCAPDTARNIALTGGMAFTSIWAGFLIVGNHFCYWVCHEGAQNVHYQMTIWGIASMILIAIA